MDLCLFELDWSVMMSCDSEPVVPTNETSAPQSDLPSVMSGNLELGADEIAMRSKQSMVMSHISAKEPVLKTTLFYGRNNSKTRHSIQLKQPAMMSIDVRKSTAVNSKPCRSKRMPKRFSE